MKPRRWFVTPELLQWKYRVNAGEYGAPFFWFPRSTLSWKADVAGIVCPRCGSVSYNLNDITFRYCSRCGEFHEPWKIHYEA